MKKVLVILVALCFTGVAQAAVIYDGATNGVPNMGYMDVTAPEGNWGSGWGVPDLRTTVSASSVILQTNINGNIDNPGDPYWDPPGHIGMKASSYVESGWGEFTGQDIVFNFEVLSNNLGGALDANGAPIVTEAFIKVLDAGASWATGQEVYEALTVGAHSITLLNVGSGGAAGYAAPIVQVGYHVISANDGPGSPTADLGAVIVPEPMTIGLLGLGGLFLRRRK